MNIDVKSNLWLSPHPMYRLFAEPRQPFKYGQLNKGEIAEAVEKARRFQEGQWRRQPAHRRSRARRRRDGDQTP